MSSAMDIYFSDHFDVAPEQIEKFGALNISLVADLPLFVDPFLLFTSKKAQYQRLHDRIISYLRFLRKKSFNEELDTHLIDSWFRFPEVSQTWLGFSKSGNRGSGLGRDFANALHENLHQLFTDFGKEHITRGSHLEKLCLIKEGVGRDCISDFTSNLIRGFLLDYTQRFARKHIAKTFRRDVAVRRVDFDYDREVWTSRNYDLPWFRDDFVLLVPVDILTKDETWINKSDLVRSFESIPTAIPNEQLRAQINNYFRKALPLEATGEDRKKAAIQTLKTFPELIDYYILQKENNGSQAVSLSSRKVSDSQQLYICQFGRFIKFVKKHTRFYEKPGGTYEEAHERIAFLKDVIENKGGHRHFYMNGQPLQREEDVHLLYRLTWFATSSDVSREVNDGRGPADFKISKGARDKTIVEFKLAKNSQLKRNLRNQVSVYKKASDAKYAIKVIFYFSLDELNRVEKILKELNLTNHPDVILVDARRDNKPSASRA